MHPVYILLIILGVLTWGYWIHLVNDEINKLQTLAEDSKKSSYEVRLSIPEWGILKRMSQHRVWVILALVLAPLLVVTWGLAIIFGLFFILLPSAAHEVFDDVRWTIKKSNARHQHE